MKLSDIFHLMNVIVVQTLNYLSFKEIYLSYADSAQCGSLSSRDSGSFSETENGVYDGLIHVFQSFACYLLLQMSYGLFFSIKYLLSPSL